MSFHQEGHRDRSIVLPVYNTGAIRGGLDNILPARTAYVSPVWNRINALNQLEPIPNAELYAPYFTTPQDAVTWANTLTSPVSFQNRVQIFVYTGTYESGDPYPESDLPSPVLLPPTFVSEPTQTPATPYMVASPPFQDESSGEHILPLNTHPFDEEASSENEAAECETTRVEDWTNIVTDFNTADGKVHKVGDMQLVPTSTGKVKVAPPKKRQALAAPLLVLTVGLYINGLGGGPVIITGHVEANIHCVGITTEEAEVARITNITFKNAFVKMNGSGGGTGNLAISSCSFDRSHIYGWNQDVPLPGAVYSPRITFADSGANYSYLSAYCAEFQVARSSFSGSSMYCQSGELEDGTPLTHPAWMYFQSCGYMTRGVGNPPTLYMRAIGGNAINVSLFGGITLSISVIIQGTGAVLQCFGAPLRVDTRVYAIDGGRANIYESGRVPGFLITGRSDIALPLGTVYIKDPNFFVVLDPTAAGTWVGGVTSSTRDITLRLPFNPASVPTNYAFSILNTNQTAQLSVPVLAFQRVRTGFSNYDIPLTLWRPSTSTVGNQGTRITMQLFSGTNTGVGGSYPVTLQP